jgi:mRNA interferase RelE/StbE
VTESLRENPRPAGAKMLTGMHGVLRIRVAGDYRVLYTIDDDRLVVLVVDAMPSWHRHKDRRCHS